MPYLTVMNLDKSMARSDVSAIVSEFDALRAELDDIRTKYAALQAALNAGTAIGAAGYPNATMQLGARRFTPT